MSYVSESLLPGEEVIHQAKFHWAVYLPGAVLLLFSFFFIGSILFAGFAFLAVCLMIRAFIYIKTTEFAITNKRVIIKVGFIRRFTAELQRNRLESLNLEQSVLGRILDYGSIIVSGTGTSKTIIHSIDEPVEFRKNILALGDAT